MTDGVALLAAIRANPDEDVPRLAYADWLEENAGTVACDWCSGSGQDRPPPPVEKDGKRWVYKGPLGPCPKCHGSKGFPDTNAARAEFIRVQCELARIGSRFDPVLRRYASDEDNARSWELVQRERELLGQGRDYDWFFPRGRFGGEAKWNFRRGFVEVIACSAADWLEHGDAICAGHPVRAVTLTDLTPFSVRGMYRSLRNDSVQYTIDNLDDIRRYLTAEWPGIGFKLLPGPDGIVALGYRWPVPTIPEVLDAAQRGGDLFRDTIRQFYTDIASGLGIPPHLLNLPITPPDTTS